MSWKERGILKEEEKEEGRYLAPILHVYNVQHVLKKTTLKLIIGLTASC